jgi:hypothetical protein
MMNLVSYLSSPEKSPEKTRRSDADTEMLDDIYEHVGPADFSMGVTRTPSNNIDLSSSITRNNTCMSSSIGLSTDPLQTPASHNTFSARNSMQTGSLEGYQQPQRRNSSVSSDRSNNTLPIATDSGEDERILTQHGKPKVPPKMDYLLVHNQETRKDVQNLKVLLKQVKPKTEQERRNKKSVQDFKHRLLEQQTLETQPVAGSSTGRQATTRKYGTNFTKFHFPCSQAAI